MKGFISYAHADERMFQRFRMEIGHIERSFDIVFWADESIKAGEHWNDSIRRAIEEADVFLMLASPAYLNSNFIRNFEMPAILARWRAVSGLACPVIMRPCAWNAAFGRLQAVPTRGRRLVPISEWKPHDGGYDQSRHQIEAAIRAHFNLTPKSLDWFSPLLGAQEEQPGPIFVERDGRFDLDVSGSETDDAAATEPVTVQLHGPNRAKAQSFATRAVKLGNQLGSEWDGLIAAAEHLASLVTPPTDQLPDRIAALWEGSVRLASFLELDKKLLTTPSSHQEPLPADVHRALDDLIGSMAPWVRAFPTARDLDDARGAYLANPVLFAPAVNVTRVAKESGLLTDAAAASLDAIARSADRDGAAAQKAANFAIRGARNLVTRSGSYVAGFLAGAAASGYAAHSPLIDGVGKFLARAESSVAALIVDFPADFRHALHNLISRSRKPGFPYAGDQHAAVAALPDPLASPPADYDLRMKHEMILRGEPPRPDWRPFVTALDFSPRSGRVEFLQLTDLTPLAGLTALQSLDLSHTQVSDVTPLAGLTTLQSLSLQDTRISDVTPLARLTGLQILELSHTRVGDVTPLANLSALKSLNLMSTPIADVRALASLAALETLNLEDTRVTDFTPLTGLTVLRSLYLAGEQTRNIAALGGLINLKILGPNGNPIR